MNSHEETALQLALTEGGVPHAATPTSVDPNTNGNVNATNTNSHGTNNANHLNLHANANANDGTDATLLPLAMPPSPTLLSHAHAHAHHHHHGGGSGVYGGGGVGVGRLAMLSEAGHSGPAAHAHPHANAHAHAAMANAQAHAHAGDLHAAAMAAASVHSYFQHDADAAALAAGISVHHFDDMDAADKSVPSGSATANGSATNATNATAGKTRKRKSGANVSIDLQTKIRLIELAEEFQYDPKNHGGGHGSGHGSATRGKGEGAMGGLGGAMSGMRLAAQFGLNKSTVSRILKRKDEFKKAYYKDNISGCSKHINKKSKFEKLNRLVENWFDVTREKKVAVSDTLIRDVGKRFAEELGIEDFRGSNGWVRSLRNRKEQQARNMSLEAMERERLKKEAEAMERVRAVFPAGIKDMAGFFKDLTIYLEKDGGGLGASDGATMAPVAPAVATATPYLPLEGDDGQPQLHHDGDTEAEEFLKKKMIESLRSWSQELLELDLTKMKSRMKPRPTQAPTQQQQQPPQAHHLQQQPTQQQHPTQLQQQQQQQQQLQQQQHQTAVI